MKSIILVLQIVISVALISSILLQSKGTGLGTAFGGGNESYRSRRGIEELLHRSSIILAALFFITSILNLLVH
ncbi:MAG: preprotein translocase subunit SecG [Patescibacteria group bacterium]